MNVTLCVTRPWPGIWTRTVVCVIVFVVVFRTAPDAAIPLGLGGWLGGWLALASGGRSPSAITGGA